MKKRSIKFEISFSDKWLYFVIFLGVFLISGVLVFAYNSGKSPNVFGHSAEELEGVCKSDGTGCPNIGGITFITPVVVESVTTNSKSNYHSDFKTFDASGKGIPVGTKGVILEAVAAATQPDGSPMAKRADILIRKDYSSSSYVLLSGASSGGEDKVAWGGQGVFPIDSNRKFQYQVVSPGFNDGYIIRLIGYF
jgi:hypothetical protein